MKFARTMSAKVLAFTAIQLTAESAIRTDIMAELRLPKELRARTNVVLPDSAPIMPSIAATKARTALPTKAAQNAPLKVIREPMVAPVTKLDSA